MRVPPRAPRPPPWARRPPSSSMRVPSGAPGSLVVRREARDRRRSTGSASPRKPLVTMCERPSASASLLVACRSRHEQRVFARHAAAVVGHRDEPRGRPRRARTRTVRGAGVDGVLAQLLHHARRALDHLASGDLVDERLAEAVNATHGRIPKARAPYTALRFLLVQRCTRLPTNSLQRLAAHLGDDRPGQARADPAGADVPRRPAGTCCSKTCPGWARRRWPRGWPGASRSPSRASSSPPTCCPATSSGRRSSCRPPRTFEFRPGPGLPPGGAGRRAQPRAAAHPVGAARGDGPGPGEPRRRDPRAAAALRRSSPPRTRSISRAPTPCPTPSSIASSCGCRWATSTRPIETQLLDRPGAASPCGASRRSPPPPISLALQEAADAVQVSSDVADYAVRLARRREHTPEIERGISTRAVPGADVGGAGAWPCGTAATS